MGDRSYSKDLVDLHSLPVKNAKLLLITDIPKHFHASNLRNFFSQFVESSKFLCFHYRHRPDVSFVGTSEVDGVQLLSYIKQFTKSKSTCCAVLSVYDEYVSEFFRLYSGLNWPNENDVVPLELKCTPHLIKHATQEEFDFLPEFKPLSWMPRGNVGTPTQHFFNLIKECKLESSIISRLNLNFLKQPKSRKYGAVPFIYANDEKLHTLESNDVDLDYTVVSNSCIPAKHRIPSNDVSELFSDPVVFEDDDDIPEEWDRFEALHDDPYDLNRGNKAQLKYEGKIELVWEKGGSGLVFHTDQRTWEKLDPLRKEEIFDEPSSFDWDIDMGPYEMPTGIGTGPCPNGFQGADRDTAELIDINREKESIHVEDLTYNPHALFTNEVINKGYGGQLLKRMGWIPGNGLGAKKGRLKISSGIIDPITCEGSLPPKVRTGLGYYGPRILRNSNKRLLNKELTSNITGQALKSVYIRSVFDSPQTVVHRSGLGLSPSLLRRNDPTMVVKWLRDREESLSHLKSSKPSDERVLIKNRTIILNGHSNLSKEGISFVFGGYLNPP
ncbi:G patch domain-containing protein [Schistosoma japonicum]|uniref:G patch domain-containing protein n=1 Tax=Schistosoma japonicum TaxID=6182 RepID=A0A4Z2DG03_SCHJA|nr:G patch domain-containing protein [Schistosoma japonicum]